MKEIFCALFFYFAGLYSEAVEWHKEEVNCSEAANDILGAAIGHRKIGECLCELSEFEEALKHQKKHLKVGVCGNFNDHYQYGDLKK